MDKKEILNYLKLHKNYYKKEFGIQFIGIFGSFAKGNANNNSDIDILYKIEKNRKLSIFKYLKIVKQLEDFFNRKIDLVREETLKPQIRKYIKKDINYV